MEPRSSNISTSVQPLSGTAMPLTRYEPKPVMCEVDWPKPLISYQQRERELFTSASKRLTVPW